MSMNSPYRSKMNLYEPMISDKDRLIAQLKAQCFEYEQNDKNYLLLNQKFRALQNEYSIITEEKLKLEYESAQRIDFLNKQVLELKQLSDSLQDDLNDKINTNKKLFIDNTNFYKTIEQRNEEVDFLKKQIREAIEDNERLIRDKQTLEENGSSIHEAKLKTENQLAQYIAEHKHLNQNIYEQREELKRQENEKTNLINKIEDLKFEIEAANKKLISKDENLLYVSQQLDQNNEELIKQNRKNKDLESVISKLENDITSFSSQLNNQKQINNDLEKRIDLSENHAKEKDKEIAILKNEINSERINYDILNNEKNKVIGDREKLKNQLVVLMEQNLILGEEIKTLVDRDEHVRSILEKRPKTKNIYDENRRILENSCMELNGVAGGNDKINEGINERINNASQCKKYGYNSNSLNNTQSNSHFQNNLNNNENTLGFNSTNIGSERIHHKSINNNNNYNTNSNTNSNMNHDNVFANTNNNKNYNNENLYENSNKYGYKLYNENRDFSKPINNTNNDIIKDKDKQEFNSRYISNNSQPINPNNTNKSNIEKSNNSNEDNNNKREIISARNTTNSRDYNISNINNTSNNNEHRNQIQINETNSEQYLNKENSINTNSINNTINSNYYKNREDNYNNTKKGSEILNMNK